MELKNSDDPSSSFTIFSDRTWKVLFISVFAAKIIPDLRSSDNSSFINVIISSLNLTLICQIQVSCPFEKFKEFADTILLS